MYDENELIDYTLLGFECWYGHLPPILTQFNSMTERCLTFSEAEA